MAGAETAGMGANGAESAYERLGCCGASDGCIVPCGARSAAGQPERSLSSRSSGAARGLRNS